MREKAVFLFHKQATKNTQEMMGERNLIEREKATEYKSREKNLAKKKRYLIIKIFNE